MNELNETNMYTENETDSETAIFNGEDIEDTENSTLNGDEFLSGDEAEPEKPDDSADKKKAEHEANEAKRKKEWEEKQAKKKAAYDKAIAETAAMTDDDIMDASVKKIGADLERVTRRNMKMCVTEHIQTLFLENAELARKAMHPLKNMINCFKYINQKAREYLKQEMEMNDEKPESGGYGADVPDDLCYKWAEDYFNDPDAEVDKDKDDKFVPKTYYGGGSSSKSKKKESPKNKNAAASTEKPASSKSDDSEQMKLFDGEAN